MATMPREAVLEFYLNGWTEIAARQTQPITITRGRRDWSADVSPAALSAVLDDRSGNLNPDNPVGLYYGLLGQNTPLRFSYVLLRDTYGRTVADGWGSTTPDGITGHAAASFAYTLSGTAADFDVASGVGTMAIASASTQRRAYLPGRTHRRVDVTLDIPSFALPASGNNVQSILLRGASLTNYVAVDVDVTSAGVVRIAIRDTDDTTYLVTPTTVTGVVRTAAMRLRAQVEGTTIRGKLWNPSGSNEPFAFHATAVSTAMAYSGWVGVRAANGTGNTSVTYQFDSLITSSVRMFGVAGELLSDAQDNDKFCALEGASELRRLESNRSSTPSAMERFVVNHATQPLGYWPLNDGPLAKSGRFAAGTNAVPAIAFNTVVVPPEPGRIFGNGTLAPWFDTAMLFMESAIRCGVASTYNGSWTVHILVAFDGGLYGDASDNDLLSVGSVVVAGNELWNVRFYSYNQQIVVTEPGGSTVSTIDTNIYDGAIHHIGFRVTQNGADCDWYVILDGAITTSGTVAALTNPPLARMAFQQLILLGGIRSRSVGHGAVYAGNGPPLADIYDAAFGHAGEPAGRRAQRLCLENGISFSYRGDLDATAAMGPQGVKPLLALLKECADTDQGTLTESSMAPGLMFITGGALRNQTTSLTLDLGAGQLDGNSRFRPRRSDQDTRNQITVQRLYGGQYTATQTTGPFNINDPGSDPDGVNVYDARTTVNTETDAQLIDVGSWLLHLGTTPDRSVPEITVEAANSHITDALDMAALDIDIDDRIVIQNVTGRDVYDPISQLARGLTETVDTIFSNTLQWVGVPEGPYHILILDDATFGRLASATTILNEDLTTTETGADVAIADGVLWTTTGTPFGIRIGGETMTVTAVTGASSPQTFTVTRSVNGVVKAQATGAAVALAEQVYLA